MTWKVTYCAPDNLPSSSAFLVVQTGISFWQTTILIPSNDFSSKSSSVKSIFAPGTTTIEFSPFSIETVIGATPVELSFVFIFEQSTPVFASSSRYQIPFLSFPTAPKRTTSPGEERRAACAAWFAPFRPRPARTGQDRPGPARTGHFQWLPKISRRQFIGSL